MTHTAQTTRPQEKINFNEIIKNYRINALAIGVPYNVFQHITPVRLEDFVEAYKKQKIMRDEENWLLGIYVESAVATAVEHVLAGRKATSKYIESPILRDTKEKEELSEEEKKRQSELFLAKLEIMAANFELNKK